MKKTLLTLFGVVCLALLWGISFASTTWLSFDDLPSNCISANDGCNSCGRVWSSGEWACTLMACLDQKEPVVYTCLAYEDDANMLPDTCLQWNDGCNSCFRSSLTGWWACTKMYCENPGPASCSQYATWPVQIVKEWELTNGTVSPQYQRQCLPGLQTINPYADNRVGGWMLCYDPAKGTPVCQPAAKGWYPAEGRYYPNGDLLRMMECYNQEPVFCTMQYEPVCASVAVQCIKAPCPAQLQTFWNSCMMNANPLATYLYDWVCVAEDISGLEPWEWYVYNEIKKLLDKSYDIWKLSTPASILYTETIVEKVDALLWDSTILSFKRHKYEQIRRFLQIYIQNLQTKIINWSIM